jgi:hypothetical protein
LWNVSLPSSNKPPADTSARSWKAVKTSLIVAVISYVLFYPLFEGTPILNKLLLPGQAHYFMMVYVGQPIRFLLGAFLFFYFLPDSIVKPMRLSSVYQWLLRGFKDRLAPVLSALAIIVLAVGLVNHYAFTIRDGFGSFCEPSTGLGLRNPGFSASRKQIIVDISPNASNTPNNICISTGVYLETGQEYVIGIYRDPQGSNSNPKDGVWTFWGDDSFMGGQPISRLPWYKAVTMAVLYPLRRTLDRGWNAVILRVGSTGSEEDFLDHNPPAQTDEMSAKEPAPEI